MQKDTIRKKTEDRGKKPEERRKANFFAAQIRDYCLRTQSPERIIIHIGNICIIIPVPASTLIISERDRAAVYVVYYAY